MLAWLEFFKIHPFPKVRFKSISEQKSSGFLKIFCEELMGKSQINFSQQFEELKAWSWNFDLRLTCAFHSAISKLNSRLFKTPHILCICEVGKNHMHLQIQFWSQTNNTITETEKNLKDHNNEISQLEHFLKIRTKIKFL
jgi:hypothetical protein